MRLMDDQTGEQIVWVFWGTGGLKDGECLRLCFVGAAGESSEPNTNTEAIFGPGDAGQVC